MDSGDPSSSHNVHNDYNGVNALVSSYCICYIIPKILFLGEIVKTALERSELSTA